MKRGKLSEKDRMFIIAAKHQAADPKLIAKQLDRSVDLVQKIMDEVQTLASQEEVEQPQEETPETVVDEESEVDRLRAENEYYKQITGKKPKGVVVMTPGASQRVDDMKKVNPAEYFDDRFMARHPNRRTAN
jgi:hypothetical protein